MTRPRILRALGIAIVLALIVYAFAGRNAGRRYGPLKAAAERNPIPDFTMPSISGEPWTMSKQKGSVVLVNFWATWCPPCRAETPALVKVAGRYRSQGFHIAGVTMDDDPDAVVPDFVRRYNVNYPILVPEAGSPVTAAIETLPVSFLVDKAGRIARTYMGMVDDDQLEADIAALLAE
jgi:thiol-disulfide isomerase/thioredoxin